MSARQLRVLCALLAALAASSIRASKVNNLGTAASGRGSDSGYSGGGRSDTINRLANQCLDHCLRRTCSNEQRVKEALLCGYDRTSRPVQDDSAQIRVHLAVALFHILDTDEKHQTFSALMSIRLRWTDEYLNWDPADYNGTTNLHIPSSAIWTPDIVISNSHSHSISADESSKKFMTTNVIVWNNGSVLWMFPAVVKVTCTLNVRYFPFDKQTCMTTFISWTYHLHEVDVWHDEEVDANKNYYVEDNQEWNVSGISFKRDVGFYACCPEPWPDVTIIVDMTRRSLFYVFNLIFPCLLMYLASFLGFFLPIESGEKVNLELTILLALVVFLLIVGDTLPPTPDAIPLVGVLFGVTMVMVSLALVMGVIVTNIHVRKFTCSPSQLPPRLIRAFLRAWHCEACRKLRRRRQRRNFQGDSRLGGGKVSRLLSFSQPPRSRQPPEEAPQAALRDNGVGSDAGEEEARCNGGPERPMPLTRLPSHLSLLDYDESPQRFRRCQQPLPPGSRRLRDSAGPDQLVNCVCSGPEAWVTLARLVDRLLFWIFLAVSVGVMTGIYSQVPDVGLS